MPGWQAKITAFRLSATIYLNINNEYRQRPSERENNDTVKAVCLFKCHRVNLLSFSLSITKYRMVASK